MTATPSLVPDRVGTSALRAAAFADGWTRWYTGRVSGEAADRRRAEIESDVWEQLDDGRESAAAPGATAASITWRVVAGIPADLSWMRQQRAMTRGASNREKESVMNTFVRLIGRWWWVALAVGLAGTYIALAVSELSQSSVPYPEGVMLALGCAAIILAGVVLRAWFPFVGGLLIVAGAGPAALIWWAPILASLAVLVLVGAAIDLLILPGARRQISAPAVVGRVAALLAAVLATVAPLMLGVLPGGVVTGLVAVGLIVAAVVRRSRPAAPSGSAPAAA